jgi:hypothetical protein
MDESVTVPLVIYTNDGGRQVLGEATVDSEGRVSCKLTTDLGRNLLDPKENLNHFSISLQDLPGILSPANPYALVTPLPAFPAKKEKNVEERDIEVVRGLTQAKALVMQHVNQAAGYDLLNADDTYVVWFCKTLQNWKALVSTTLRDDMYYEVTYNGDRRETYLDAYKKIHNLVIKDDSGEAFPGDFIHSGEEMVEIGSPRYEELMKEAAENKIETPTYDDLNDTDGKSGVYKSKSSYDQLEDKTFTTSRREEAFKNWDENA